MVIEEGKIKIEKSCDTNFGFWKIQIKDYLYKKKVVSISLTKITIGHKR